MLTGKITGRVLVVDTEHQTVMVDIGAKDRHGETVALMNVYYIHDLPQIGQNIELKYLAGRFSVEENL